MFLLSSLINTREEYTMSKNEDLHKVGFEADETLYNNLQAARAAGCMYNGKRFSNRLAYEMGVKLLLGISEEEEEEALNQKLADVRIKKTLMDNQEKLLLASLEKRRAKKQQEIKVCSQVEADVQKLADRIIQEWNAVKIYNKAGNIGFIYNMYPTKIDRASLEKVFAEGGLDAPTIEEAQVIASALLGVELND